MAVWLVVPVGSMRTCAWLQQRPTFSSDCSDCSGCPLSGWPLEEEQVQLLVSHQVHINEQAAETSHVCHVQALRPRAILDVIQSAEDFRIDLGAQGSPASQPRSCERCGYICSQRVCKACQLLEGLNKGLPGLGVKRTRGQKGGAGQGSQASAQAWAAASSNPQMGACNGGCREAPVADLVGGREHMGCGSTACAHHQPKACSCGTQAGQAPAEVLQDAASQESQHGTAEASSLADASANSVTCPSERAKANDLANSSHTANTVEGFASTKQYEANLRHIAQHPSARIAQHDLSNQW